MDRRSGSGKAYALGRKVAKCVISAGRILWEETSYIRKMEDTEND
nr:MAG TPA: hypothetical protein [Caudoviricetes sp.]